MNEAIAFGTALRAIAATGRVLHILSLEVAFNRAVANIALQQQVGAAMERCRSIPGNTSDSIACLQRAEGELKDGTEYPISPGAISILGEGNAPLIARPYKDKGGEIALGDATLGTIAGLAKVGEIINQPEEITEDLLFGGSRTRSRGNNRNIAGAFLQGAFGKVAETMGSRTQKATSEITSRPNIWYVPANTKISIVVNRSIKLY